MNRTIDINAHLELSANKEFKRITNLLFKNTAIHYFCFQRYYADNYYTFLASSPILSQYFCSENAYHYLWIFNAPYDSLHSGVLLWDIAKNFNSVEQMEIYKSVNQDIGLGHGVDIIQKFHNYLDIYTFASSNINIYHSSMSTLKQFIFYFKQKCHCLIQHALKEKIIVPLFREPAHVLPILSAELNLNLDTGNENLFEPNRYYLQDSLYLTKKELICLDKLAKGNSTKEAARVLNISVRTVESHLANLKTKLGCSSLTQAIDIARINHLII